MAKNKKRKTVKQKEKGFAKENIKKISVATNDCTDYLTIFNDIHNINRTINIEANEDTMGFFEIMDPHERKRAKEKMIQETDSVFTAIDNYNKYFDNYMFLNEDESEKFNEFIDAIRKHYYYEAGEYISRHYVGKVIQSFKYSEADENVHISNYRSGDLDTINKNLNNPQITRLSRSEKRVLRNHTKKDRDTYNYKIIVNKPYNPISFMKRTVLSDLYYENLLALQSNINTCHESPEEKLEMLDKIMDKISTQRSHNIFHHNFPIDGISKLWMNYEYSLYNNKRTHDYQMFFYLYAEKIVNDQDTFVNTFGSVCREEILKDIKKYFSENKTDESITVLDFPYKEVYDFSKNFSRMYELTVNIINKIEEEITEFAFEKLLDNEFDLNETMDKKKFNEYKKLSIKLEKENEKLNSEIETLKRDLAKEKENKQKSIDEAVKKSTQIKDEKNRQLTKDLKLAQDEKLSIEKKYKELQKSKAKTKEEITEEEKDSTFNLASYLKIREKRMVFVCDYEHEQYYLFKQILKAYPNSRIAHSFDDVNYKNTDLVVMMIRYQKHCTYYGAKSRAVSQEIPIIHCKASNIDLVNQTLLDAFK